MICETICGSCINARALIIDRTSSSEASFPMTMRGSPVPVLYCCCSSCARRPEMSTASVHVDTASVDFFSSSVNSNIGLSCTPYCWLASRAVDTDRSIAMSWKRCDSRYCPNPYAPNPTAPATPANGSSAGASVDPIDPRVAAAPAARFFGMARRPPRS